MSVVTRAARPLRFLLVALVALAGCTGSISGTGGSGPGMTGPGATASGAGGAGGMGGATGGPAPMGPGSGTANALPPGTTMTKTPACASAALATGPAYLRRLTRWEYANTIADVLKLAPVQMTQSLGDVLPADIRANGFSNDFGAQLVSVDHASGYQAAADAVGAALDKTPGWLAPFAACAATTADCRDQIVKGVGLRLFRRPATPSELTTFGGLFDTAVAAGMATAPAAASVVVRGMLQTPQFLYRLESQVPAVAGAPARALDNFEIASRLSYFLWSSAPDEALLAAAQAGDLTAPDKLKAQVTRMLGGPHAREVAQRYFREWLTLDDLDEANRGAAYTPELAAAMKQETLDVAGADLWDTRKPLTSMFTSKSTIVTPVLAKFYGVTPGAGGRVATAPGRTGILTQAGVLTVNGDADASIVLRGLYVMRKLLCGDVPPPPPGATSVTLAPATVSQRAKSDARLAQEPCKTCHGQFDPLAYAFEPFNEMGALITKDVNGNAVKSDGWVVGPGTAKTPYTGVDDYMAALAKDPRVGDCVDARVAQFAWGRAMAIAGGDACLLEDVRARLPPAETRTFADVVTAVASSPYFLYTSVQ